MLATPDDEWHHGKKSAQREQYLQNQAYLEAEATADHEEHIMVLSQQQKELSQHQKVQQKKMAHQEKKAH